jgi:hypothetical protein
MLYDIISNIVDAFPKNTNFYSLSAKSALSIKISENIIKEFTMKLSNQAMGALMMALQKSLLEQSDIVPVLNDFVFEVNSQEELVVKNPPNFKVPNQVLPTGAPPGPVAVEKTATTGSD